jgi:hypothetical protein
MLILLAVVSEPGALDTGTIDAREYELWLLSLAEEPHQAEGLYRGYRQDPCLNRSTRETRPKLGYRQGSRPSPSTS